MRLRTRELEADSSTSSSINYKPVSARRGTRSPVVPAHGDFLDVIALYRIAQAWRVRHADCALRGNFHCGFDDVLVPVAVARRDITRQSETRQRRHRNVVGAANPGFQHAPTPGWNTSLKARRLHCPCFGVAADASQLDVNNPAGLPKLPDRASVREHGFAHCQAL